MYGLEPVYEPQDAPDTPRVREFAEIQCPACGEVSGTMIDVAGGDRVYIEDCQVCCQAMTLTLEFDDVGRFVRAVADRA